MKVEDLRAILNDFKDSDTVTIYNTLLSTRQELKESCIDGSTKGYLEINIEI